MSQQNNLRHVSITEFLTKDQIQEVFHLRTAKLICDKVIKPNISNINQKLGQENDPMYLAYMIEHILNQMPSM